MLKGWKTFVFFGAVSLTGILATIDAQDITNVLVPALCKIDPSNVVDNGINDCVTSVVALGGKIMLGIGIVGKALRWVTTSGIFKPE